MTMCKTWPCVRHHNVPGSHFWLSFKCYSNSLLSIFTVVEHNTFYFVNILLQLGNKEIRNLPKMVFQMPSVAARLQYFIADIQLHISKDEIRCELAPVFCPRQNYTPSRKRPSWLYCSLISMLKCENTIDFMSLEIRWMCCLYYNNKHNHECCEIYLCFINLLELTSSRSRLPVQRAKI
jgi:hypothetical protein